MYTNTASIVIRAFSYNINKLKRVRKFFLCMTLKEINKAIALLHISRL